MEKTGETEKKMTQGRQREKRGWQETCVCVFLSNSLMLCVNSSMRTRQRVVYIIYSTQSTTQLCNVDLYITFLIAFKWYLSDQV